MSIKSVSSLWWEEIQGPRSIIDDIYKALCDSKSVVLAGKNVPWSKQMRSLISVNLQETFQIYTDEICDAESMGNPGKYLLNKFGKKEDKNNYREGTEPLLPEYIRQNRILEKKLVFISGMTEDGNKAWVDFINSYKPKKIGDGLFLIEIYISNASIINSKKIVTIDTSNKISFYDILSFSMLLASKLDIDEIWKQYIAWVVSLLFNDNIELLANIIANIMPQHTIQDYHNIIEKEMIDKKRFEKSLWTAQIQIIFPIIENLRLEIIGQYEEEIRNTLQVEKEYYCGNRITDPFDAEVGFLFYLSVNKHIFSWEIHQNISFLHECRNKLAHVDYCDVSAIERISDLYTQRRKLGAPASIGGER